MTRLEIIHLRSHGISVESLSARIAESIETEAMRGDTVRLYRREGLETDVAIHINRAEDSGTEGPSVLGLRLASALKAYGLVEHTIWEKLR